MYVTIVYVKVKTEHIKDFIDATAVNHRASIKEPGNMRFDVLQHDAEAGSFVLYEAYKRKRRCAPAQANSPLPGMAGMRGRLDGRTAAGHRL